MLQYKFYYVADDGHIFRAEDHVFGDDLSALKAAEGFCVEHGVEVWHLARMVARVKKDNAPLSASDGRSL